LVVLALIAAGIFLKQTSFYPSVNIKLTDPSSLTAPSAASLMPLPPDLQPLSPMEAFDAANLSDKINGKAELYLSAGFRSLQSQRFQLAAQPEIWAELLVYHMDKPANAFAVFSTQKRSGSQPVSIAEHAYQTENALFFVHGPYYVEIVAAMASSESLQAISQLAKAFSAHTPVQKTASLDEKALFPAADLIPGSTALQSQNVFGFEQLNQIYTAQYEIDGSELTAFLSRRSSPDEAKKLATAYVAFLLSFGGSRLITAIQVPDIQVVSIMNAIEMVYTIGPYLAGVHEAANIEVAENMALRLSQRLQEVRNER
jgi:hypothetical protein